MDDMMEKIQEVLSDEESMKQLSELASSLFSSSENNENENENETSNETGNKSEGDTVKEDESQSGMDFDFSKLFMIAQMMSTVSDDKNSQLLLALKPLLKEERQARVDKAVKILKLLAVFNMLKDSGMLESLF